MPMPERPAAEYSAVLDQLHSEIFRNQGLGQHQRLVHDSGVMSDK